MVANDREICAAGDSHEAGIIEYVEGGLKRVALNSGSIQNGGFGKRFFSITNNPYFPCIALSGTEHIVTPYFSVKQWLNAKK